MAKTGREKSRYMCRLDRNSFLLFYSEFISKYGGAPSHDPSPGKSIPRAGTPAEMHRLFLQQGPMGTEVLKGASPYSPFAGKPRARGGITEVHDEAALSHPSPIALLASLGKKRARTRTENQGSKAALPCVCSTPTRTPNKRAPSLSYLRAKIKVKNPTPFRRFEPPLLLPPRRS